jgi:hypothetical protein
VNGVVLAPREQRWECLSCDKTALTIGKGVHTEMHHCRSLAGLMIPMVPAGTRGEHRVVEREDYIGSERVQYAPGSGRPVMAVQTIRDEGQDCVIFAPLATASGRAD